MSVCAIQAYFKKEIPIYMTCGERRHIQGKLHKRLIKIETLERKLFWPEYTYIRCACDSFRPTVSFYESKFFFNYLITWRDYEVGIYLKTKWKQACKKFNITTAMNSKCALIFFFFKSRLISHVLDIYHLGKWCIRCYTKVKRLLFPSHEFLK